MMKQKQENNVAMSYALKQQQKEFLGSQRPLQRNQGTDGSGWNNSFTRQKHDKHIINDDLNF